LRHDRLVDFGQRLGKARKILFGEAVFGPAIGIDGALRRPGVRSANGQCLVGFALSL
jgi:hypothetical protein